MGRNTKNVRPGDELERPDGWEPPDRVANPWPEIKDKKYYDKKLKAWVRVFKKAKAEGSGIAIDIDD